MKRYKLLKDTPTIKAGTIFKEVVSDFDELKELVRITPVGAKTSPQWTIQDINNFNDWFEEIKEYKRWRAEKGKKYWFVYASMEVDSDEEIDCGFDDGCWESGNYFKTKEEAELYKRKLVANQKLIDAAKKAWFEFDGSEDWDMEFDAYYIASDLDDGSVRVCTSDNVRAVGVVYFPTEKSAQAYIDNNLDDLKLLFGAE